jgi:hypothetical protein
MSRYSFINNSYYLTNGEFMSTQKTDLLTAGNIAKELKVSDAVVKKAIQQLGIKPTAKKGVCNYYSRDVIPKIKTALK